MVVLTKKKKKLLSRFRTNCDQGCDTSCDENCDGCNDGCDDDCDNPCTTYGVLLFI